MGDINDLAKRIGKRGLINPILITREGLVLVAGERRLRACKQLGWDRIPCQYEDEASEFKLKEIELEENIKRKDMEWQEERTWLVDYHEMHCARDPKWSWTKTADEIGMSQQWVSEHVVVHEEGKFDPTIYKEKKFRDALRRAKFNGTQRAEAERQKFEETLGLIAEKPKDILNTDFTQWVKTYKGPKFNFLHCDFPYGIDNDERQQGNAAAVYGGYDDSEENYWRLLDALCTNLDRICEPSAHLMFWFHMNHHDKTRKFLAENSDFTIDEFPLVWMKSDGKGMLPRPDYGPRRTYETCLFGWRGGRRIIPGEAVANSYAAPTDPQQHMSTKPESVLKHFFRMVINENSRMLDPACGSGTALRAAEFMGAKQILGIEIDKVFADRATRGLEEARRRRDSDPDS